MHFLGILIFVSFLLSCQKEDAARSFIVAFLKGTAQNVSLSTQLKLHDSIVSNQKVHTDSGSTLDLKSDTASLRLLGDSEVDLPSVKSSESVFQIVTGNILVKCAKLPPGSSLRVITPSVTVSVRGTQFWGQVRPAEESGTFAVREGSIAIVRNSDKATFLLEKGQALDTDARSSDWKVRPAASAELEAMSQIDNMP